MLVKKVLKIWLSALTNINKGKSMEIVAGNAGKDRNLFSSKHFHIFNMSIVLCDCVHISL